MICKDISLLNRQRRRAANRRLISQGLAPRHSPNGQQVNAHLHACTQYIVNIDGKTITVQVEKLEHSVPLAAYAHDVAVSVDDLLEMKPGEKVGYFGSRNLEGTHVGPWQRQMAATMAMSPGVYDPLDHYLVSWQADEEPTPEQLERAVDIVLHVMGLSEHQTVFGLHINTANHHLHVAVNRVHPVTFERVQPGDGRSIYALHQAIAIIEHEQGWKRNKKSLFIADDHGVVHCASGVRVRDADGPINFVPKAKRDKVDDAACGFAVVTETLSSDARQYERRTGIWSLERRAKVIAGPIIRCARSAAEMHADLADHGLGYERRGSGSGAVLTMSGQAVPATNAGRHASIANLEKIWGSGTYTERAPGPHNEPSTPPELRIEEFKVPAHYQEEKSRRRRARQVRQAEIDESCHAALQAIDDQTEAHRAAIDQHDWTGRGDELNVARSVVSAGRAAARDAVAAVRTEALANLKASSAFPPFANWAPWLPMPPFDQVAASQSAALVSRFHDTPAVPIPLRHHVGVQVGRQCHYQDERGRVAFRDLGSLILIDRATDLEAVKDALRLAAIKWGADQIVPTGDRAFLQLLAKAAFDLNLEINDKTVAKEVRRLKTEAQRAAARARSVPPPVQRSLSPIRVWSQATTAVAGPAVLPVPAAAEPPRAQPPAAVPPPVELQPERVEPDDLDLMEGLDPLIDRWIEAYRRDPKNFRTLQPLAFAIMHDSDALALQQELAAADFTRAPDIAGQSAAFAQRRAIGIGIDLSRTTS